MLYEVITLERRREEPNETFGLGHEARLDGVHGAGGAARVGQPGEHRPRLRQGVDAALVARLRAERAAVVVPAAQVPLV